MNLNIDLKRSQSKVAKVAELLYFPVLIKSLLNQMMDSRNHHPAKFLHGSVNKLIATRDGDLRQKIIEPTFDRRNELYSRFGDRLVLKQDYSEKLTKVADKVDRQTKQVQLDPTTDDKWGHDRYDGRSKSKSIKRSEDSEGKD